MINNHQLGLAPLSSLSTSPDEFVYLAKEVGFDFVGLRVLPVTPTEPQFDLSVGSPLHKRVLRALEETGLFVLDSEFLLIDGSDQRDQWRTAIERAASFGAKSVTLAVSDTDIERVKANLSQMVEDGKGVGVKPAVEAISYQFINSIPLAVEVAQATGAYFLPDTLHITRFGGTPVELAKAASAGVVPMLQLCDTLPQRPVGRDGLVWESRAKRAVPGEGSGDLAGLIRALPAAMPISVETPDEEFIAAHGAKAWMERIFKASTRVISEAEK